MSQLPQEQTLYEYKVSITGMTEYGTNLAGLLSGTVAMPASGARFDVYFEGPVTGEKVVGTIKGIDYLRFRADGRMELDIHAEITTEDGRKISVKADGVCLPRPESSISDLKENVTLFSTFEEFSWVNPLQVWATGTVDLAKGQIHIKGYEA